MKTIGIILLIITILILLILCFIFGFLIYIIYDTIKDVNKNQINNPNIEEENNK